MRRNGYEYDGIEKKVEIDRKENLHGRRLYWFVRRAQDIVLSSVVLVVLSPVMLIAIVVDGSRILTSI